jgi:hypothetical protein
MDTDSLCKPTICSLSCFLQGVPAASFQSGCWQPECIHTTINTAQSLFIHFILQRTPRRTTPQMLIPLQGVCASNSRSSVQPHGRNRSSVRGAEHCNGIRRFWTRCGVIVSIGHGGHLPEFAVEALSSLDSLSARLVCCSPFIELVQPSCHLQHLRIPALRLN